MRIMPNDNPLRIAINAQKSFDSSDGGVVSILIGLITALGKLEDGDEEFTIIGPNQHHEWLTPYLGPNMKLVPSQSPLKTDQPYHFYTQHSHPFAKIIQNWFSYFINQPRIGPQLPLSNGFYEQLGCDLIHFPYQSFCLCAMPMIYNPHDLQHLHFPQFFTPRTIQWRELLYQAGCHYAQMVIVGSQWVRKDLINQYHLSPEKIQVIPWGPPTEAFENPSEDFINKTRNKYGLPAAFAFYPAMLWPHKNHHRLLQAVALLRDQEGVNINLVCTGDHRSSYWPTLEKQVQELGLANQVIFLGRVPFEDLRALYKLSEFVIIPTLFEAASGPVFEAWHNNVPVTCSNVTSLPEQVKDAALLFDPFSVEAISQALMHMKKDKKLRNTLLKKGGERLKDFSWTRTAKAYRAVYRKIGKRPLTEEDDMLLRWDWMQNPTNTATGE